jgi:uncharacterized protein (TIGR03437 family)
VWLALALLPCSVARGQAPAPAYSVAGIVNAASSVPGPFFAPNSIVSLYGSSLSSSDPVSAPSGVATLPLQLGGVSVYVDSSMAPLLYVSATQINFLIPSNQYPDPTIAVPVHVVRQSVSGPIVTLFVISGAPALFGAAGGYALAEDWNANYAVITADAPAHGGDTVILYATGLGLTQPNPLPGATPLTAASIPDLSSLKVLLAGTAIDPALIKYAGLSPGFPGLYQINLVLPKGLPVDPEVVISMGGQSSLSGLKLAVR